MLPSVQAIVTFTQLRASDPGQKALTVLLEAKSLFTVAASFIDQMIISFLNNFARKCFRVLLEGSILGLIEFVFML